MSEHDKNVRILHLWKGSSDLAAFRPTKVSIQTIQGMIQLLISYDSALISYDSAFDIL
jgi:hypothetical protein